MMMRVLFGMSFYKLRDGVLNEILMSSFSVFVKNLI